MLRYGIPAVLLLVLASPAFSQPSAAEGAGPSEKPKLICRRDVEIGSLVRSKKRCYTRDQWDQLAKGGRNAANDLVDRARLGAGDVDHLDPSAIPF